MYQKVLVPLDGSQLAESALDHVKGLAKVGGIGDVVLLRVVEIPSYWITEAIDMNELQKEQLGLAQTYLDEVKTLLDGEGIKTTKDVIVGRASQEIVRFAKANNCDLIVIASHGYTGLKQWVFGSVALRVLHDSHVPVLLIRPESHQA